jgi:hypothetical protein
VGDLLRIGATGGRVESGVSLACLGAFRTGYLPRSGCLVVHSGPPNTTLFQAIKPGQARITLFAGDPFHHPTATTLEVDVRPVGSGQ